jgi:AmmeMemoRadiSam system protein A
MSNHDDLQISDHNGELLMDYAERALVATVTQSSPPEQPELPILKEPLGLFVTLRRNGSLRGCIGNFAGPRELGELFFQVVEDTALSDRRFQPVTASELPEIAVELSILGTSYEKESAGEFHLGSEGIILAVSGRRSVFLPEVPTDQGWDLETTLSRLAQKAGLSPDAWRENSATFFAFRSIKIQRERYPGGPVAVHLL